MRYIFLVAALLASACQPREDDATRKAVAITPGVAAPAQVRELVADWSRLGYPATRECGIVGSSDWSGQLITTPGASPRLVISGQVSTKPTTRLLLRLDPRVMESYPVQRMAFVEASMPSEPTPDIAEGRTLRGEWPIDGAPGVLTIPCGRTILATIRDDAILP